MCSMFCKLCDTENTKDHWPFILRQASEGILLGHFVLVPLYSVPVERIGSLEEINTDESFHRKGATHH